MVKGKIKLKLRGAWSPLILFLIKKVYIYIYIYIYKHIRFSSLNLKKWILRPQNWKLIYISLSLSQLIAYLFNCLKSQWIYITQITYDDLFGDETSYGATIIFS